MVWKPYGMGNGLSTCARRQTRSQEANILAKFRDLRVLVCQAFMKFPDSLVRAGDGLLASRIELCAQEDDLFGKDALDVTDKLDRIERNLAKQFVDELIRLHVLTLVVPIAEDRDIGPLRERRSHLRLPRPPVPFLVTGFRFGTMT